MRWEYFNWEAGTYFNPGGKSRKARRLIFMSDRLKKSDDREMGRREARRVGLPGAQQTIRERPHHHRTQAIPASQTSCWHYRSAGGSLLCQAYIRNGSYGGES
jgi:hypothetical protein